MNNQLIKDIVLEFSSYENSLFLLKNTDGFFNRNDVKSIFSDLGIRVCNKKGLSFRIDYEINYKQDRKNTIYLINSIDDVLEDISIHGVFFDFNLSSYLGEYHIQTVLQEDLSVLDKLYLNKPDKRYNKRETEMILSFYRGVTDVGFDIVAFEEKIFDLLDSERIDWFSLIERISNALLLTIGSDVSKRMFDLIENVNNLFQKELLINYKNTVNSSFIKKPKIVSSVLDYMNYNYKDEKVALIVVDGMSYWQYLLLKQSLNPNLSIIDDIIYSWIPSITQLSRQAIFRGARPSIEYRQNPINEERLWKEYWREKGFSSFDIRYDYNKLSSETLDNINKLAVVYSDLDEKMHSSTDYIDLKSLTLNWLDRTKITENISSLTNEGFVVYLTTDHGNIQAKGWRNLKGKEKLGSNKSGSRSSRHIEYTDRFLADEFLDRNEILNEYIVQDENVLYMSGNLSFSKESDLVTHGGSHFLEVVIPFIRIAYE